MSISEKYNSTTISQITTKILLSEPFYGHFMLGMPKSMCNSIETASINLKGKNLIELKINPEFWNSINNNQKYGLIKHEVLHIVFKHLFLQRKYANRKIFNLAADLVVNQYIKPQQLPEGAILLSTFNNHQTFPNKLEAFKTTDYYYKELNKIYRGNNKTQHDNFFLKELLNEDSQHQKKHNNWECFRLLSGSEIKIFEHSLFHQLKNIEGKFNILSNPFGNIPKHLVEYIEELLNEYKPKINWKIVLKKFTSSSNSSYLTNTIRRPSKRYGTTPGVSIKRKKHLLIAIDTSASVSLAQLQEFFGELHSIWKQGAKLTIVECDFEIQGIYPYKGKTPNKIKGRGGTNLSPPIKIANTDLKPDGIIYFTDGYAFKPEVKSKCRILWVITPDGISKDSLYWEQLYGQKIKINSYE